MNPSSSTSPQERDQKSHDKSKKKSKERDSAKFKLGQTVASKTVRYVLKRKIGETRSGIVFKVINERDLEFAMKVEYRNPNQSNPKLGMEITILRHLRQNSVSPHFVEYIDRCAKSTYYFMITSLIGLNMNSLLGTRDNKPFTTRTAIGTVLQALEALKELHSLGYIHRDVRPHNLCMGLREKSHLIYLINFGLSAIYIKNKKIRKPRSVVPMKAQVQFAAITSHDQMEQSPKDDIESLIYTMYALCDSLPWKDKLKPDEVKLEKRKCRTDEEAKKNLHKKLDPKLMSDLIKYLDDLSYFDPVDYEYVKRVLVDSAKNAGISGIRDKLNWEMPVSSGTTSHGNSYSTKSLNDDDEKSSETFETSKRVFDQ